MHLDQSDFILSEKEVASAVKQLHLSPSGLGIRPTLTADPEATKTFGETFQKLGNEGISRFSGAMKALANPVKTVKFHYSIADESLTRSFLVWDDKDSREIITMVRSGAGRRISVRTASSLQTLVKNTLAVDSGLKQAQLSLQFSASALIVWLAIVEQIKLLKLHALLKHGSPEYMFNRADIDARLAESEVEDFRWPLMFFTKVMPVFVPQALSAEDITNALSELGKAELIEAADESGKLGIFEISDKGKWLVDELLHEVSKVGMGITAIREDGELGHELMLFIRSSAYLFLFNLSGTQGVMASLAAEQVELFLEEAFSAPEYLPSQTLKAESGTSIDQQICPSCENSVSASAKFCPECGANMRAKPVACPSCNTLNKAGAKFCEECGTKL